MPISAVGFRGPKTEPAVVTVFNLQAETFAAVMALEDASGAQLAGTLTAGYLRSTNEVEAD